MSKYYKGTTSIESKFRREERESMTVGERIKDYLEESGRTQKWLSRNTGIPTAKLSLSFSGRRKLSFEEYELICGALAVDTNKFIVPRLYDKPSHTA
jgi:hypothetical protein